MDLHDHPSSSGRRRRGRAAAAGYNPGYSHNTIESVLDIIADHDHEDFKTTNLLPLKDEGLLESIVSHVNTSRRGICPSPPEQTKVKVTRRRTYSKRRSRSPTHEPIKCRDSTWTSSVRSYLANKISKSQSRIQRLSDILEPVVLVPQTEKELDKFLLSVWGNEVAGPSFEIDPQTAIEIEELKEFYDKKMCELKQNHKLHLSKLEHLADTSCTAHRDWELTTAINDAKSKIKNFDRLRFDLKQQVAGTILEVIPESLVLGKRLSSKAASIMARWLKQHLNHPYPSAKQKQDLARRCAITVERVSTWFSGQRSKRRRKGKKKRRARSRSRGSRSRKGKRGRGKRGGKTKSKGMKRLVLRRIRVISG